MFNVIHKIRYVLMNKLNIKAKPKYPPNSELVVSDDFRTLRHWASTYPNVIQNSRTNGATLTIKAVNTKGFACPLLISHEKLLYGGANATITTNQHTKTVNIFTLRTKEYEWGFKIVGETVVILLPAGYYKRKLYHSNLPHKYSIYFDANKNKIFWRINDITVCETPDNLNVNKHVQLSLGTIGNKFASKELPQSMNVKNVEIFVHNEQSTPIK